MTWESKPSLLRGKQESYPLSHGLVGLFTLYLDLQSKRHYIFELMAPDIVLYFLYLKEFKNRVEKKEYRLKFQVKYKKQ